jgi:hypothetical protein
VPTLFGSILRNFLALFGVSESARARPPFKPPLRPKLMAAWSLVGSIGGLSDNLDLSSENIAYQLAELDGIARAFEALGCHAGIVAWVAVGMAHLPHGLSEMLRNRRHSAIDDNPMFLVEDDPDPFIINFNNKANELRVNCDALTTLAFCQEGKVIYHPCAP